jgi:carbamoyltransferase
MNIVGLGGGLHDFAACLLQDNGSVVAIEDERLTRIRYSFRAPIKHSPSIDYCLKHSGVRLIHTG